MAAMIDRIDSRMVKAEDWYEERSKMMRSGSMQSGESMLKGYCNLGKSKLAFGESADAGSNG